MEEKKNWGGARPGSGRPRGIKKPYKNITIALPEQAVPRLKAIAKYRNLSVSKLIQNFINENYLQMAEEMLEEVKKEEKRKKKEEKGAEEA